MCAAVLYLCVGLISDLDDLAQTIMWVLLILLISSWRGIDAQAGGPFQQGVGQQAGGGAFGGGNIAPGQFGGNQFGGGQFGGQSLNPSPINFLTGFQPQPPGLGAQPGLNPFRITGQNLKQVDWTQIDRRAEEGNFIFLFKYKMRIYILQIIL